MPRDRERKSERKQESERERDCFIPLHSTCTVKMQSRHARRRIHHVCECTRWGRRGRRREMSHAGFVYPLARPCIINHPPPRRWVDIITGRRERNFLERDAVSSPSVRPSVDLSILFPLVRASSSSLDARPFIYLPHARARARVILYIFRSSRSADQSAEKRAFSLRSQRAALD